MSPTTRTCSPGGQKLTPRKTSPGTLTQPSSPPSCMECSANGVGRSPPGASHGPLTARRKQITAPWRPCVEYPPLGGGPRRAARPVRKRDTGWLSKGRPRQRIVNAIDAPFRPSRPRPGSSDPGRGLGPHPTQYIVDPWPKCLSKVRAAPFLQTARIKESSSGISPVPRASATDQYGRSGGGLTMAVWWVKAGGQNHHQGPRGWCLGGNKFLDPSRGKRVKVGTFGWRQLAQNRCFLIFPYFWYPDFPLFQVLAVWPSSIRSYTGITCSPLPQHQGGLPLPLFGGNFLVILHDFIRQNYHKNQSYCYTFPFIMINYPIFLINYHILYFQMYYQYLFFSKKYPNNVFKKS